MIKKHLMACSVMVVLMVVARMFIYSNPGTHLNAAPAKHTVTSKNEKTTGINFTSALSFANEDLPIGDPKIDRRMYQALKAHKYAKLQTNILHSKAAKWFPVIEPILRSHGIPDDFKYVPLVESGLQSGTSPRGASGYWQFMPGTARTYGLRVNGKVDERQNMRKSTAAACKYLNSMFAELKSWTLVAAAYNVGDVKLKQQIDRQSQDNYFKMKLNRETAAYVYKLISMKEIIEKPLKYGYKQPARLLAFSELNQGNQFIDPALTYTVYPLKN